MNPKYMRFSSARITNLVYAAHVMYLEQDDPFSDFALGLQREIDYLNGILERRATQ